MFIDCERTPVSISDVPALVSAAHAAGGYVMLRTESAAPAILTRYLDCGIDALVVPQVESAAACSEIVGTARDQAAGIPKAAIIVQIESTAGVAAAQDIAQAPGVDAVLLGPNDLAISMGFAGQPGHPQVQAAVTGLAAILREAAMIFGLPVTTDSVRDWALHGASLFYIPGGDLIATALTSYNEATDGH
ncbi:aldolase/citrate lyase family protein [Roseinatronobacter thiooxidans]|nr:aldolase/citrate lyase family protein [Roseinatronobacter thiooxidans]